MRVIVRRQFGVRSLCEGRLMIFDRHLNMVLLKATESAVLQPACPYPAEGKSWPRATWECRWALPPCLPTSVIRPGGWHVALIRREGA